MSGPVGTQLDDGIDARAATADDVEVVDSRPSKVGPTTVLRALPTRARRTVGPWCFVDHAPPHVVDGSPGMQVGPHPHIGLQTVTWLLAGEVVHRDSLGSEQPIRPGQLNLMTAGFGVAHAEQTPSSYRDELHALQLWVAQPESTRHGQPAFEHHSELPIVDIGACTATVLVGELVGAASPARRDTDHFGADLVIRPGPTAIPLSTEHEHAIVVVGGRISVSGHPVNVDQHLYVAPGRAELTVEADEPARALLLGGVPFEARPLMWWNFVARERAEIDDAYEAWQSGTGRFGPVESSLDIIPAPLPPWRTAGESWRER